MDTKRYDNADVGRDVSHHVKFRPDLEAVDLFLGAEGCKDRVAVLEALQS